MSKQCFVIMCTQQNLDGECTSYPVMVFAGDNARSKATAYVERHTCSAFYYEYQEVDLEDDSES